MILQILKYILLSYSVISALGLLALVIAFGFKSFKFWYVKNLEAIAAVIGIVLFPITYLFRKSISKNPKFWKYTIFYWLANSDEKGGGDPKKAFIDNWYGVYQIFNNDYKAFEELSNFEKFKLSYKWVGFRNPSWNFKLLIGKHVIGKKENSKCLIKEGTSNCNIWRNKTIFGKQYQTFTIKGNLHFRYSFTRRLHNLSPLRLFGYNNINVMLGTGTTRYISKFRLFN